MNTMEMTNVKKRYGNFQLDLSLNVQQGETIGLVGRNGAGKTTLMGIVLNIVRKDDGHVLLFGMDHVRSEATAKEKIGVVLEDHCFFGGIKTHSILNFCSSFYPKWNWEYMKYLQKKLDIDKTKKFHELSMGMKKKLFLLIALSCDAELLLLDEPTANLDPKVRNEILDEVQKIKIEKKPSIVFSSHNMVDVEKLADRIILLEQGRVVFNEEKSRLLKNWKRITFHAKNAPTIKPESKIVCVNAKQNHFYEIIVNDFSDAVVNDLHGQSAIDIAVSAVSLEEIFLNCIE